MARGYTDSLPYSITGLNPYPWINWWYRLVAPPVPPHAEELPLREREFLRRGKLISIALLINFIEMGLALLRVTSTTRMLLPILGAHIALLIVASVLNRFRKLLLAGIIALALYEVGLVQTILGPGPLDMLRLPELCLWVEPIMISVLLFPAWCILLVGGFHILLICSILLFAPHTMDLQFFLNTRPYDLYIFPIDLQVCCALISYTVITSLRETLLRADKAEEVSKLQQVMAKQSRQELEKKVQLETWCRQVINILTRVSNGDWNTRLTPEGSSNELWAASKSINNMISRYGRLREETQSMEKTVAAVQAHLHALRVAKVSGTPVRLPHTNTPIDLLVKELKELPVDTSPSSPSTSAGQQSSTPL